MATNKGDVDLVIRARNDASKTLDTVEKAIEALVGTQKDLSAESGKTSSALADFAKIAATVGNAYSRITSDADKAAAALSRQEATLAENKSAYTALAAQIEAAARVQQQMANFVGPRTKDQAAQVELVAKAYSDLSARTSKLGAIIDQQEAGFRQSYFALQDMAGGAEKAAVALEKVKAAQQGAADAATQQAAADQAAAAASTRRAALELRRDMSQTLAGAQTTWKDAQTGIAQLRQEMAAIGPPTREQADAMAQLMGQASAGKTAYKGLQVAIAQYNQVLRTEGATQEQVAAAQARANVALTNARSTMTSVASSARQVSQAVRTMATAETQAAESGGKLDKSLTSLFANSRRSLSIYQRLRGQVLALASSYVGLYGAINGFNKILQSSLTIQATESRLNVVTGGDVHKTGQEMQWVTAQAQRLGIGLNTMASEWSKFAVSAQASNMSMADARKIFTSVAEASRVLNLDTQSVDRVFVALTQMMGKGTIQMEELRQQLGEHLPSAFADMAKAVGVSTAQLIKMMQAGQVTSDYLVKFADVLSQRYGGELPDAIHKTQAEMGRFETNLTLALNKIGDAGAVDAFTNALRELQKILQSPDADIWFQRLGRAISGVIQFLLEILKNLDLIIAALAGIGAAKGVAYVMSLGKAFSVLIAEMRTATGVAAALGIAMDSALGPIGIVIGVVAAGFAYLATSVSDADKAISESKKAVEDISAAYVVGSKSADAWAKSLTKISALQIQRDLSALKDKVQAATESLAPSTWDLISNQLATVGANGEQLVSGDGMRQIIDLSKAARDGQIDLEDYKKKLDAIGQAHPELADLAIKLQKAADEAAQSKEDLAKFEAAMRLMGGTASDADKTLLGLNNQLDDAGDSAAKAAAAMEKYTAAMARMGKNIPDLKKSLAMDGAIAQVKKDLDAALKAAGTDQKLRDAAQDRANQAIAAIEKGQEEALLKSYSKGSSLYKSARVIQGFEGFQPTAKWDVNAYRAGFGSDTVTLSDGSIQKITQGMTVTQDDALRDLGRRIGDFQDAIKERIGGDRWNAFSNDQQAALTSIAYNYGSLPERIVNAVKHGTSAEIATAVRGLAGDNGGINAKRRNAEADLLGQSSPTLDANNAKQADKAAAKQAAAEAAVVKKQETAYKNINLELDKKITKEKVSATQAEINNALAKTGLTLESEKGRQLAQRIKDANAERDTMLQVNDLVTQQNALQEQIKFAQKYGNADQVTALRDRLAEVNDKLVTAATAAIAFYQAMGGPQADAAIGKLDTIIAKAKDTGKKVAEASEINQSFAQGATQAFTSVADAIGAALEGTMSWSDAFAAAGDAFRKFAADFLSQIAQMILQAAILKLLTGSATGGAGGFGGGIAGWVNGLFKHDGGVVDDGGTRKAVMASWFDNAVRYHNGGIAGLKPNEVPTVLEKGEEVLTANDPRHSANGGMIGKPAPVNLKVVNAFDAQSVLSEALSGRDGTQSVLNFVKSNSGAMRAALGV